jgi:hypothetical protein
MFGMPKNCSNESSHARSVRDPRWDAEQDIMAKQRITTGSEAIYNVAGAAAILKRASSTVAAAIESGELVADVDYRSAAGKTKRMISAVSLRAYRDLLATRLETYTAPGARSEAARLRSIDI